MTPTAALREQIARYRGMTGEQRLAIALELHELACGVAREGIRAQNPDASPADVERLLSQLEFTIEEFMLLLAPLAAAYASAPISGIQVGAAGRGKSGNLYLGAVNAYKGYEVGYGKNQLTGETQTFPDIAKAYHEAGQPWVVIGDENMGEGSSREHAAMEPRFRLGLVAIARSFARIHETNLKKQGMLPLTFADPADYDRIGEDDRVSVRGLAELSPGLPVTVEVAPPGAVAQTLTPLTAFLSSGNQ